jgi:ubiquinone/menaquinone biosynthesis C-methylase UbiE
MDETERKFQQFEREGWEQVATTYAGLTEGVTSEIAGPLLDAAGVSSSSRVVDIATGPGWVAREAQARGAEVVGVDIAEAMIEGARKRLPDIQFVLSAAEDLNLPDCSFDAAVSAFGMPHFADHRAFALEAARVLRPGGRLAFASWYPPPKNDFFAIAIGAIDKYGSLQVDLPVGVDMFRWSDQQACDELFALAGFGSGVRHDVELHYDTDIKGAGIIDFMRKASVRTRALFEAQSEQAKLAIAEGLAEFLDPYRHGNRCRVPLHAFVVSATKTERN